MGINELGSAALSDFADQADEPQLRGLILDLVGQYARQHHAPKAFVPGHSAVPVSGKVYGASDMQMLVDSALDFWLTTGRFNTAFEERLAARLGVRHALTVNSGSSANLVALSSLTSHYLRGDALKPGDEVITVATGFPTTVNPSLQYGLVPVFVDVDIPTYNVKPDMEARRWAWDMDTSPSIKRASSPACPFDARSAEILGTSTENNFAGSGVRCGARRQ